MWRRAESWLLGQAALAFPQNPSGPQVCVLREPAPSPSAEAPVLRARIPTPRGLYFGGAFGVIFKSWTVQCRSGNTSDGVVPKILVRNEEANRGNWKRKQLPRTVGARLILASLLKLIGPFDGLARPQPRPLLPSYYLILFEGDKTVKESEETWI